MATNSIQLDQELIDKAKIAANASGRTMPKQIEHWVRIGKIMEDNPDLNYEFVEMVTLSKTNERTHKFAEYLFN